MRTKRVETITVIIAAAALLLPMALAKEIVLDDMENIVVGPIYTADRWEKDVTTSTEAFSEGKKSLRYESSEAVLGGAHMGTTRWVLKNWNQYTKLRLSVKCTDANHGTMFIQLVAYTKEKKYAGVLTHVLLAAGEETMGWKEVEWDISGFDLTKMNDLIFYSMDIEGGAFKWKKGQKMIMFVDDVRLVAPDIKVVPEDDREITIIGNDFPKSAAIEANSIKVANSNTAHEEIVVEEDGSFECSVTLKETLPDGNYAVKITDDSHEEQGAYTFSEEGPGR